MYILRGADGRLYTGSAWSLSPRLEPSSIGLGLTSPAGRLPLQLVYSEWHERIDEAYYRERQIHRWRRWRKELLIAEGKGAGEPAP